jgi:hypothetical protein
MILLKNSKGNRKKSIFDLILIAIIDSGDSVSSQKHG